ncbi:MAG: hypothetical protein LBG98_02035 [Puniceicoccales bacterium]|jgi:tetratricopeptide (TPR) repeat protein|nr:hypothetical protein [Puniceicoccales bacterium]
MDQGHGEVAENKQLREGITSFIKGVDSILGQLLLPQKDSASFQAAIKRSQSVYQNALQYLFQKEALRPLCLKIFQSLAQKGIESALKVLSDEDTGLIEREAEGLMQQGKSELSGTLFQLLTLFSHDDNPNLYAYMMLAEDVANEDLETASKIYDFLINLFPENPALLLSAAECYKDIKQFKHSLSLLEKAEQLCLEFQENTHSDTIHEMLENIQEAIVELKPLAK